MRSAALIFGLLAGLLGGAVIVYGNLQSGLAASPLAAGHDVIASAAVYAVIAVGLLGAGLALFWPRFGGALLLLCAVAWMAAAIVAGHGAVLFAGLPFTFAAAAAFVALFAPRRAGRELAEAPQDRRYGRSWEENEEGEDEEVPPYAPRPRGLRGRAEPEFGPAPARRGGPASQYRVEPPEDDEDEDEPEQDFVDADEAVDDDAEPAEPYDDEEDDRQAQNDTEEDDEPGVTPEVAPPPRQGRRQGQWSLPDPEQSPAPQRARQRYVPERQAPEPARRQPLPPNNGPRARRQPAAPDYDIAEQDFSPPRREFQPRARNDYREFEPYEADGRRREGPLRGLVRLLVLVLFILVVGGIAAAVYFDFEQGPRSILFGSHRQTAEAQPAASPTPAAAPVTALAPAPTASATPALSPEAPEAAPGIANSPAAGDSSAAAAADNSPAAATAPAPAASTPQSAANVGSAMSDPFKYCQSVQTIDAPDSSYTGPAMPHAVAAALGLSDANAVTQAHWRCANQQVMACDIAKGSAACDLTPTVDLMLSYCAQHPNAQNIAAPNGSWSCNGKRPVIPRDQQWPVDDRGFYPGAWTVVNPPASG